MMFFKQETFGLIIRHTISSHAAKAQNSFTCVDLESCSLNCGQKRWSFSKT